MLQHLPPKISSLTWLRELNLYGSPIDDYAPIKPLSGLHSLKLGSLYARFPGLDFLTDWDGLKIVNLISTTPLDLAPLRRCTGLERLSISCSQHKVELTNLSALRGCRDLAHVVLLNIQSDEYTTVAGWTALTFAQIVGANLPSLEMFRNLMALEYLNVRGAPISDLTALSGLFGGTKPPDQLPDRLFAVGNRSQAANLAIRFGYCYGDRVGMDIQTQKS